MRRLIPAVVLALAASSCGYFNSLYNANRQFAAAERARERGDFASARNDYLGSIDKAAKSYRKYPHGRWSDDALLVIARARFELGEYPAARAAFAELLGKTSNKDMRATAHAYAGATEVGLSEPAAAVLHLDSALAAIDAKSEMAGFAHLWRARANAASGNLAAAWADLDAVSTANSANFDAVQLERINLALQANDTVHAHKAFAALLGSPNLRQRLDTLSALTMRAAGRFGARSARDMLATEDVSLPAPARDTLALIRAEIAVLSGDTTVAHRELTQLAERAALPIASAARVRLARSRLEKVTKLEQLPEIRSLLLPAINSAEALNAIRDMRIVEVLAQRSAETGQPLAIFTAAEVARDELRAPLLARQLFTTYIDVAPTTPWAGKALLAAIAIDPSAAEANALRDRMRTLSANPYITAVNGGSAADAIEVAEERLARSVVALRAEAAVLAQQREGAVTRAVAVLDSIKAAARADTMRVKCGVMLDTLAVVGIRADSVRAACLRGDGEMVAAHLKTDTLMWNPAARDSILRRQNTRRTTRPAPRDTIK